MDEKLSQLPSLNPVDSTTIFLVSSNTTGNLTSYQATIANVRTAVTGNVTFNDQVIQGTGDENGGGGLYLAPGTNSTANLQFLRVRGGDYPTHIHLDTGNNNYFDQYFGADFRYVKLEANGNIVINADDDNGNSATWSFTTDGNLVIAGGNSVIQSIANSSLDPTLPNVSTMTLTPDANYASQVLVLDPTAPGHIHLRAYAFSNIDEPAANIFLGGEDTAFEITSGANNQARIHSGGNTWTFSSDGIFTLPAIGGNEGGEIHFTKAPNSTLTGDTVKIDNYIDQIRFFEGGGTARGMYIDIANSPASVSAAVGYRDIPQVVASNTTLSASDAGKHYYSTTAGNITLTIPNNATTSFQTGTAINIVIKAAGNILVNAASGVTLYMAGSSTTGNRVVGAYGMATLMKVESDTWFINGTGVY